MSEDPSPALQIEVANSITATSNQLAEKKEPKPTLGHHHRVGVHMDRGYDTDDVREGSTTDGEGGHNFGMNDYTNMLQCDQI